MTSDVILIPTMKESKPSVRNTDGKRLTTQKSLQFRKSPEGMIMIKGEALWSMVACKRKHFVRDMLLCCVCPYISDTRCVMGGIYQSNQVSRQHRMSYGLIKFR